MGLVDYSSDSDTDSGPSSAPPPQPAPASSSSSSSALPPLPPTFHDLYAHTVRTSTTDDPALHQGRRRQIPHVQGQWPSHLYVEWRPAAGEHAALESLLDRLRDALLPVARAGGRRLALTGFLTSEVGAVPLPLHVSLSRPFVLAAEEREGFLAEVRETVARARVGPFILRVAGVEWHRTEESGRSFLVLRVRSRGHVDEEVEEEGDDGDGDGRNPNPELTVFLARCNAVVAKYGQPQLYQWADDGRIGDAFHVSIAWSFAEPDEELRRKTAEVFADPEFAEALGKIEIRVDGIKAKIGNVVNHMPLHGTGKSEDRNRTRGLFGI